ncbi:hypothetical protein, partial [Paenibacillus durus]
MYPPRSSKKRSNNTRKKRKNRIWSWINFSLLALITVLLFYLFYSGGGRDSIPLPETGTASPSPERSAAAG